MDQLESLPENFESILKTYLSDSISLYIKENELTEQQKIELLIVKKTFYIFDFKTILTFFNFSVSDDREYITLEFTEELKQYIKDEYKKYNEHI